MSPWREIRNELAERHWTHIPRSRHDLYRCPCGEHSMCVPRAGASSSVDPRTIRNARATMRRCHFEEEASTP